MKTKKIFTQNLQKGIITAEMLGMAIYSMNKRAKNCRDRQAYYRELRISSRYCHSYYYDKYHSEEQSRIKKEEYYSKKEELLSIIKPVAIHILKHNDYYTEYFLFYKIGDYSFHSPISESDANQSDLEKTILDSLITYGKDINDLLSCQFVDKMLSLIHTGKYILTE